MSTLTRHQIKRLFYITHINNIPSILKLGILSHHRAEAIEHVSIALEPVQERRHSKVISITGKPLHSYVNLFINPRNTMLYYLLSNRSSSEICVLGIDPVAADVPGVIVSDRNAAKNDARFAFAPEGFTQIDIERVFAERWSNYGDRNDVLKAQMCAEVLIPDRVPTQAVRFAYANSRGTQSAIEWKYGLKSFIHRGMFFDDGFPYHVEGFPHLFKS
jgi:hypothetical protein